MVEALPAGRPIHVHIAEPLGEVEQSLAFSGVRPVRYLMDHVDVDARWCLVHATHLDDAEIDALADSGAVAGLCPTTEANLGDGVIPLSRYLERGGRIGIGSDSKVSVSPVEELRWLEYGQRLAQRRRNVAAPGPLRVLRQRQPRQARVRGRSLGRTRRRRDRRALPTSDERAAPDVRIIRRVSPTPARWKNGGGSTITIAVEPTGASLDDFDWRVSLRRSTATARSPASPV